MPTPITVENSLAALIKHAKVDAIALSGCQVNTNW
jgi:hypothetical protein